MLLRFLNQDKNKFIFEAVSIQDELQSGKLYSLKEHRSSRSIAQNSKLWALIQELADKTGNDEMDIYISALEKVSAKYEWIGGLPAIEADLKKVFRAVKPFGTFKTEDNKELVRYKCFIGSSKFDTKEMMKLIDYVESEVNA